MKPVSRAEVTDAIRSWVDEHGRVPSYQDMNSGRQGEGRPNAGTAQTLFGSWSAAVSAAGFQPKEAGGSSQRLPRLPCRRCGGPTSRVQATAQDQAAMCRMCRHEWERDGGKAPRYTDEQLLQALREWAKSEPSCNIEIAKREMRLPSVDACCRRFGGWFEALREAGIVHPLSDEGILNALRDWASHRTHLTGTAWAREGCSPDRNTVAKRFGSWIAALEAAGLPPPSGQGIKHTAEWRTRPSHSRQTVSGGIKGATVYVRSDPTLGMEKMSPRPKKRGGSHPPDAPRA